MKKTFNVNGHEIEITPCTAIAAEIGESVRANALYVHDTEDEFGDGDSVYFEQMPRDDDEAEEMLAAFDGFHDYSTMDTVRFPPQQRHTTGGSAMNNTTDYTDYTDTIRRLSYNGTAEATSDHPALILAQQADLDFLPGGEVWYSADAIAPDEIRPDGTAPVWRVEWDIINPDAENEEDACDWTTPRSVQRISGEYNLNDCRRY